MMVRLFHWNAEDIYKFYNMTHPDWPNLPPPPNPRGLQAFFVACVEQTVAQLNRENGGEQPRQRQPQKPYRERPMGAGGNIPR